MWVSVCTGGSIEWFSRGKQYGQIKGLATFFLFFFFFGLRNFRDSEVDSFIFDYFLKITALLDHEALGQKQKGTLTELRFANNKFLLWGLIF